MKKFTLSILFAVSMLITKAQQEGFLISFEGSGDTTGVGSVQVINLTNPDTVYLDGGNILHLNPSLGINTRNPGFDDLQVYPNPMKEQATLSFVTKESGNAMVSVIDIAGKTVCANCQWLMPGIQTFRVSGLKKGIYLVKLNHADRSSIVKLISENDFAGEAVIEYIPSSGNPPYSPVKTTSAWVEMRYFPGDQLIATGNTGQYSTIVPMVPTSNITVMFLFSYCTDPDGHHYKTVREHNQIWMAENLKYQAGNSWYYNDSPVDSIGYGRLYDWQTALGACPSGWHLPDMAEWLTLTEYLQGASFSGGSMKETGNRHWHAPNTGATNLSGFCAFAGGYREPNGSYLNRGFHGRWWSVSEYSGDDAWFLELGNQTAESHFNPLPKTSGFSVRCVKN